MENELWSWIWKLPLQANVQFFLRCLLGEALTCRLYALGVKVSRKRLFIVLGQVCWVWVGYSSRRDGGYVLVGLVKEEGLSARDNHLDSYLECVVCSR